MNLKPLYIVYLNMDTHLLLVKNQADVPTSHQKCFYYHAAIAKCWHILFGLTTSLPTLLHFVYATAYLVGAPLGTRKHKLVKRFTTDLSVQDVGKRSVVFLQYQILTDVRMGFSFAALGEPHNVSERSSHIYLQ